MGRTLTRRTWAKMRTISTKHIVGLLVGILMLSLFTGIGVCAQSKVTLLSFGVDSDGLNLALKRFTEKTGIAVEVIQSTSWVNQRERATVMAAGGVPPDVVYCESATFNYLLVQDLLSPLDAYVSRDKVVMSRYPAAVLPFWHKGNKLYGLPTALSLHTTFYNVDLYEDAGVTQPPIDWSSKAWGWDEFVHIMRRLTRDKNGDGTPEQYGLQTFGWGGGANHIGLWGQWWVNEDVTEWYGDKPEVISALEKTVALRTEHKVIGGNILSRTAATNVQQSIYLNTLLDSTSGIRWNVGAMPMGTQRASQTGYHGIGMSRNAPNAEGAWALLKFLAYDTEGATLFTRAENRVPVLRETGQDFIKRYSNNIIPPENLGSIIDGISYVYDLRYSRHPKGNDIYNLLNNMHGPLVRGEKSVRAMLAEISQQVRAIIAGK